MAENVRAHVYVSGMVQGVFFRANTKRKAVKLGITGWARNLPDGRVEAIFEGDSKRVEEMIEWCGAGPPFAEVENVIVKWEPYKGEFHEFRIRYRF